MPHLSNSATHKFVREPPKNGLSDNPKPHEKAAGKALRQHSAFSSPAHCTIARARTTTASASGRPRGNNKPTQPNGSRTGAWPRSSAARATKLRMKQPPVALRAASIPADGAIPFSQTAPGGSPRWFRLPQQCGRTASPADRPHALPSRRSGAKPAAFPHPAACWQERPSHPSKRSGISFSQSRPTIPPTTVGSSREQSSRRTFRRTASRTELRRKHSVTTGSDKSDASTPSQA